MSDSSQATIVSSEEHIVSNDTLYRYTWISNDMFNSLPSERHFNCRNIGLLFDTQLF